MKSRKQHRKRHTFLSTPVAEAFKPVIAKYAHNILTHVDVTNFYSSVDKLADSTGVPQSIRSLVVHECREQAKGSRHGKC